MSAQIIDGKKVAAIYTAQTQQKVQELVLAGLRPPKLAVVLIGDNPASTIYVHHKKIACEQAGIDSLVKIFTATTPQNEITDYIQTLNQDDAIDGILVQLPLPAELDQKTIIELIDPQKDVDGLHPYNMGRLFIGSPLLRPCTPYGIMCLLDHYHLDPTGKKTVIIGKSTIVGRPMALELLMRRATVTLCHSATAHIDQEIANADIVVSSVGQPHFIEGKWIKSGAVVIDVGINRSTDNTIQGDVNFNDALQHASWITPVPGGVGPMTIAILLQNTLQAMKWRLHLT